MGDPGDDVVATLRSFADIDINALPPIAHYWSNRHVLPLLRAVGADGIDPLWERHIHEQCIRTAPRVARLVSLGSGGGEVEIPLLERLAAQGVTNLRVTLLDGNELLLERSLAEAERVGLADRIRTQHVDLNTWTADEPADICFACHSLHHVVELEHLYDAILGSLAPAGVFLVNDMIGRNGHQRWPEALTVVEQIWSTLDARLRFNHSMNVVDDMYPDHDCSSERFEAVRAQDVLPLLLDRFHPEQFVTFANVIDPFVDRIYGWNFDPSNPGDRALIDAIAALDESGIELGLWSPTHMIASFRPIPVSPRYPGLRSPARVVRSAGR